MNKKTKEEIILYKYINRMVDSELSKEEPDMELIDECNILLDNMEQGMYDLKPNVKSKQLQKLYSEYRYRHPQKRLFQFEPKWRKLTTAACVIVMLIGVSVTVAAVNGISPIDLITQLGNKIFSWNVGEAIEFEGISLIRNGEATEYDNIENCVKQENLDIYYTSWLPDGIYIDSAIIMTTGGSETLVLNFSDENVSFTCKEASGNYCSDDHMPNSQILVNGCVAYYQVVNNKYLAEIVLEDKVYCISANNYENMINILNGLKKVE